MALAQLCYLLIQEVILFRNSGRVGISTNGHLSESRISKGSKEVKSARGEGDRADRRVSMAEYHEREQPYKNKRKKHREDCKEAVSGEGWSDFQQLSEIGGVLWAS